MMTLEKFEEASELVKRVTNPTKLVWSEYLSSQTGGKVYLKPENMQHTGAYKIRGAYYKISTLTEEERAKGLITASAGNHAQGVAFAAQNWRRRKGIRSYILSMTSTWRQARGRSPWRSYRSFRPWTIFSCRLAAAV